MNRKHLFNALRILVSLGLVVFVCSKIRLNDTLVGEEDKSELVGRLVTTGPQVFVIRTLDGRTVQLTRDEIRHDADGRLSGVHRGIITVFRDIDLAWFIPTFLFVGLVPTVGAFRFHVLLVIQGVRLKVRRALALTFLGYFFNNFMLGLTGGDVVKAYYVARETHKRTEAVVTVFLDRVVGLIALAILAATMVLVNLGDPTFRRAAAYVWVFLVMALFLMLILYSRRLRRKLEYTLLAVAGAGGAAILIWRLASKGWGGVWHEVVIFLAAIAVFALCTCVGALRRLIRLDRLGDRLRRSKLVREMDDTLHVFAGHPGTTVATFAMSFFCHLVMLSAVFGFARALGIRAEFHYFLVFVPVIMMIAAIPVSMAGWGVQEAVFQMFFGAVGVAATEAITLSFVYRLCAILLWSLPGAVVLMLNKERPSVHEVERAMGREEPAS